MNKKLNKNDNAATNMQINELIIRSEELAKSCDSIISEEQVTVLEVLQLIITLHNINPIGGGIKKLFCFFLD